MALTEAAGRLNFRDRTMGSWCAELALPAPRQSADEAAACDSALVEQKKLDALKALRAAEAPDARRRRRAVEFRSDRSLRRRTRSGWDFSSLSFRVVLGCSRSIERSCHS